MKPRIAIISPMKLPLPLVKGGGAESLIQLLIDENEKREDLELVVYSISDSVAENVSKEYHHTQFEFVCVNHIWFRLYKKYLKIIKRLFNKPLNTNSLLSNQLAKLIEGKNYDAVVIENNYELLPGLVDKIQSSLYFHVHNDHLLIRRTISRELLLRLRGVITVSNFIRQQMMNQYSLLENRICVLKNCIDLDRFVAAKDSEKRIHQRRELGIQVNDIVILYSGRIIPEKGVKELIEAFKKLDSRNDIKLLIVGSAWYGFKQTNRYLDVIKSLSSSISDKIIFTGFVPYNKIPEIYNLADIVVMPTLYVEEAAGLVLLEAMAMSLPIITTNSGGIPEYVTNENAIIVKRDEHFEENLFKNMDYLINNRSLQLKMGESGFDIVQRYSRSRYYEDFKRIILGENV